MMIPPSFTCDAPGCRASKTPTSANGWWLIRAHAPSGMLLEPWTMAEAMLPDTKHYCGVACLNRAVDQWTSIALSSDQLERMLEL